MRGGSSGDDGYEDGGERQGYDGGGGPHALVTSPTGRSTGQRHNHQSKPGPSHPPQAASTPTCPTCCGSAHSTPP